MDPLNICKGRCERSLQKLEMTKKLLTIMGQTRLVDMKVRDVADMQVSGGALGTARAFPYRGRINKLWTPETDSRYASARSRNNFRMQSAELPMTDAYETLKSLFET